MSEPVLRPVAVTQRVDVAAGRGERRDALDQRWAELLLACGFLPVPVPNQAQAALAIFEAMPIAGLLLTGGNDLARYGGDAPERDATECALLRRARERRLPVLGVCRGMQVIQDCLGIGLRPVSDHVATRHRLEGGSLDAEVNSFHGFGARDSVDELETLARAPDGVIEALRHRREPILAQMWHPEREAPFVPADLERIRRHFGAEA